MADKLKYILVVLFSLLISEYASCQHSLIYHYDDNELQDILKQKSIKGKNTISNQIKSDLNTIVKLGYLSAYIDSTTSDSLKTDVYIFTGNKYSWTSLRVGNVDSETLRKSGVKIKHVNNTPVSPKKVEDIFKKIIKTSENNGYPFASIQLDSIQINDSLISASLLLNKNKLIKLDSIIIKGNAKINPVYLYNYLNINPGEPYNETNIKNINNKLDEIPFIAPISPPEILFLEDLTKLTIFANKKKASRFNGIVGFLPNQTTGKLLITGDIELLLNNELGRGEKININWRKIQNNVTDLKSSFAYPFIFNTPFGIEASFYLYRRDTLFQDINSKINVQYILTGANNIGLFYENKTSRLISTTAYINSTILPQTLDITKHLYGFEFNKSKLDYKYNPRKGYNVIFTTSLGNRKIIQNPDLSAELYDTLAINTTQYNIYSDMDLYFPVFKNSAINIGLKGARLESSNIFTNEQYRIGGFKTLRGFDEESIFASTYVIGTVEYRYLLERNSFARVFIDGAYYENKTITSFKNDFPFGFGLGINISTKAGIFSLDYALGYQQKQLAPIRSAKIHFGFVNYF